MAFYELRQMFLVDEINPGLYVRVPTLDQDGEFTHQPTRQGKPRPAATPLETRRGDGLEKLARRRCPRTAGR
jgi:hypothetical protein